MVIAFLITSGALFQSLAVYANTFGLRRIFPFFFVVPGLTHLSEPVLLGLFLSFKSAVNSVKMIGLKIPPWGTPEVSLCRSDRVSPILTRCDLFVRNELNHLTVRSVKPYISIFLHKRSISSLKGKQVSVCLYSRFLLQIDSFVKFDNNI